MKEISLEFQTSEQEYIVTVRTSKVCKRLSMHYFTMCRLQNNGWTIIPMDIRNENAQLSVLLKKQNNFTTL